MKISDTQEKATNKFHMLHPGYNNQRNKEWRLNYPNYMKKQYQKQIEKDPIAHRVRRLLHTTKKAAKKKDFKHSIDKQWCLTKLLNGVCEVTGLQFDLSVEVFIKK